MATTNCWSPVFGRRMRVTKLDSCGRPVAGATSSVVFSGFTSVKYSPQVVEGDDITVKNAGGQICVAAKADDSVKWTNVTIMCCGVDPDLVALFNPSWTQELDYSGNKIGFRMNNSVDTSRGGYALEVWTDLTGFDACALVGATGAWGYTLLPFVVARATADYEISNKEMQLTFQGRTKPYAKWGQGPYNVLLDASGTPKPLVSPVGPQDINIMFATGYAPPAVSCGGQVVPPIPPIAITVTMGTGSPTLLRTATVNITNGKGATALVNYGDGTINTVTLTAGAGTDTHVYPGTGPGTFPVTATSNGEQAAGVANPT